MKTDHPFFALSHLMMVLLLFLISVGSFFIYFSAPVADMIALVVIKQAKALLLIGGIGIALTLLFSLGYFFIHRPRYLQIKMQAANKTSVDLDLIKDYVIHYFSLHYEKGSYECQIQLGHSQQLQILAHLPFEESSLETQLEKIQADLSELFRSKLAYEKPFIFKLFQAKELIKV